MAERYGTEVSFRLGPNSVDQAREIAAELAQAAVGAERHVLFLAEDAGEYGCLAEWISFAAASGSGQRPATVTALARLETLTGKPPRVRLYVMEDL